MSTTRIRLALATDLPTILNIIQDAKTFLRVQGVPQWQEGPYPDVTAIAKDIATDGGWVLLVDGKIAGYAALLSGPDPDYHITTGPGWIGPGPYVMIHRLAISDQYRGQHLSQTFLTHLLKRCEAQKDNDIRMDTNQKNQIMGHLLTACGFANRGEISHPDDSQTRYEAYQLLLK